MNKKGERENNGEKRMREHETMKIIENIKHTKKQKQRQERNKTKETQINDMMLFNVKSNF